MIPLAFSVLISDLKANHKLNKILQNSIVKKTIYFVFGLNVMVLFIMCFKPADELISFYKVVYQKSLNKEVLLIVNGNENPWVRGGKNLPVSFYKSNSLTVLNIQEGIQINDSLLNNKDRIYLYAINNFDSRDAYVSKNIQFNKIYQTYPEWVERFNINNWMSRTKIRTIYEIKKNR